MKVKLVFRWNEHKESFVFAKLAEAIRIDKIHRAVFKSKTWKELKDSVHPDDYNHLLQMYSDEAGDDNDPSPTEKINWDFFNLDDYGQAYFPRWLIYEMEEIIPPDILEKYGGEEEITDMGSYRQIKPENLVPMITALTARNFDVSPAGELVFDAFP